MKIKIKLCQCDWGKGLKVLRKNQEIILEKRISNGLEIRLHKVYSIDGIERNWLKNDDDLTCLTCGLEVRYFNARFS